MESKPLTVSLESKAWGGLLIEPVWNRNKPELAEGEEISDF